MTIEQRPLVDFEHWMTEKLRDRRIPVTGMIELTPRCNFHCTHCYMGDLRRDAFKMDTPFIFTLLNQMADAGCIALSFTGGEPLLRDDYSEIHCRAHKLGFWINLMTNGSLLSRAHIALLQKYPPRAVEITLYGGTEQSYFALTGIRGAFAQVTQNIDALLDAGIPVILKSVLLLPIMESLVEMNAFAAARQLNILFDAGVTPDLLRDFSPAALRVAPRCAVDVELASPQKTALLNEYHRHHLKKETPDRFSCGAGQRGFHVDYQGNLLSCLMLRNPRFNLHHQSFSEAWEKLGKADRPHFAKGTRCDSCELQHLCGFCPGTVACGEAPPGEEDSFYCTVAKSRLAKLTLDQN